jgi:hypothetical protein
MPPIFTVEVLASMRQVSHSSKPTLVEGGLATGTTAWNCCNGRHLENETRCRSSIQLISSPDSTRRMYL